MIPSKDSPEGKELAQEYQAYLNNGDTAGLERLKQKWEYGDRSSLYKAIRRTYGIPFAMKPQAMPSGLTPLEQEVLRIVQKEAVSVGEISRRVDRSSETIIKTIDSLREKSYEVILDKVSRQVSIPQEPSRDFKSTEFNYFKRFYRIGLVSDTHLGSKYQQLTLLYDAYKIFNDRQVDFVLHAGDLVDGLDVYRGHRTELFKHGADEQKDYVVEVYPKLERNRKTYVIGGQHDRSFFKDKGYDIVRAICEKRKDLVYRGFYKAQFKVKGLPIGLQHPGGGISYALSYKIQKNIESMMGFMSSIPSAEKPILEVFGHWHVANLLPSYMGITAMMLPCFQSQTPYLEQLGKMPVVGCAIAEIWLNKDDSLSSVKPEFIIFNDRIIAGNY